MAAQTMFSNALDFIGAGYLTLIRRAPDGTDSKDPKDIYTTGRNVMGVINTAYSLEQSELPDENSYTPAAIYPTKINETLAIGMNTEDPGLDAFLKGSARELKEDDFQWYPKIPKTITKMSGAGVDGEIKLLNPDGTPAVISADMPTLVRDSLTNEDYENSGTNDPDAGQYKVDLTTGTFTFDEADVGKSVIVSCALASEETLVQTNSALPKFETFKAILAGWAADYSHNNREWITEEFDSVQIQGDLSPLPRQMAPGSKTINLQATKPRGSWTSRRKRSQPLVDLDVE